MDEGSAVYRLYVGVDVAAETFVAAWLAPGGQPGTPFAGEQTPTGFATLQRRLQATGSPPVATLVVLEATGELLGRPGGGPARGGVSGRGGQPAPGAPVLTGKSLRWPAGPFAAGRPRDQAGASTAQPTSLPCSV